MAMVVWVFYCVVCGTFLQSSESIACMYVYMFRCRLVNQSFHFYGEIVVPYLDTSVVNTGGKQTEED